MVKYKKVISNFAASILVTSRVLNKSVDEFILDTEDAEKRKEFMDSIKALQKRVGDAINTLDVVDDKSFIDMEYLADIINSLKTDMKLLKSIDTEVQELYKKIESRVEESKTELEALTKEVDDLAKDIHARRDNKTS